MLTHICANILLLKKMTNFYLYLRVTSKYICNLRNIYFEHTNILLNVCLYVNRIVMKYSLKDILPTHIKKLKVTVAEFERMSGLNRNTVQNIIRGTSIHPTKETLEKIAATLKCDIKDLMDDAHPILKKHKHISKINMFFNIEHHQLMNEIVSYVLTQLKQRHIPPQADEFFKSISEIYHYCIGEDKIAFDKKFSDWTLSNYFYNKSQNS